MAAIACEAAAAIACEPRPKGPEETRTSVDLVESAEEARLNGEATRAGGANVFGVTGMNLIAINLIHTMFHCGINY